MTAPHLAAEEARVRRAHLVVTAGLLAASALAYLLTLLVVTGDLPDRLAVHFVLRGQADGVMPTPLALAVFGAVGIGLPLLLLAFSVAGQWWRGATARMTSAFVGGLSGETLVRVALDGTSAEEVERWDLGYRIREVEQGPDGAIWLLQDGDGAALLRFAR